MPKHLIVTEFELKCLLDRLEECIELACSAECDEYIKSVKRDCNAAMRIAKRNNFEINKSIVDVANRKYF
ncbi:hypothetical protein [Thalassotalea marina]|uniref:Uncharacterized protein n=1 Tax=Thalassotalea marina TaxID=1673741 RepID=A0A919BRP0_9GAMM|nr:hypothetical protein [Thalassotalea marina]GHG07852.1 hypothetical protein GCM10017161_42020 [Thalassotalea marina]